MNRTLESRLKRKFAVIVALRSKNFRVHIVRITCDANRTQWRVYGARELITLIDLPPSLLLTLLL